MPVKEGPVMWSSFAVLDFERDLELPWINQKTPCINLCAILVNIKFSRLLLNFRLYHVARLNFRHHDQTVQCHCHPTTWEESVSYSTNSWTGSLIFYQ